MWGMRGGTGQGGEGGPPRPGPAWALTVNIAVRFCVLFREGKETQWRAAEEGVGVRVETCRWCGWLTTEEPADHNAATNTHTHDAHTRFAGRSIVRLLKIKTEHKNSLSIHSSPNSLLPFGNMQQHKSSTQSGCMCVFCVRAGSDPCLQRSQVKAAQGCWTLWRCCTNEPSGRHEGAGRGKARTLGSRAAALELEVQKLSLF